MAKKMPIRIRERAIYTSGTYAYVQTTIVPEGEIWCLQNTAYENETSAAGTFRRYIEGHGYNHYVAEVQGPGLAELVFTDDVIYLLPGERLTIRQASPGASDVLALYAHGYKIHSEYLPDEE
jgi:hypothetical protein